MENYYVLAGYFYVCFVSLGIGLYLGYMGPKAFVNYDPDPFRKALMFFSLLVGPILLLLQERYGFSATQTHLGGNALFFISGFLFGSGVEAIFKGIPQKTIGQLSRFNRVLAKVSIAIIGAYWGAALGVNFKLLDVKIFVDEQLISTISVFGILFGWIFSKNILNICLAISVFLWGPPPQRHTNFVINLLSVMATIHIFLLPLLAKGGIALQGIVFELMGVPVIVIAGITGIESRK